MIHVSFPATKIVHDFAKSIENFDEQFHKFDPIDRQSLRQDVRTDLVVLNASKRARHFSDGLAGRLSEHAGYLNCHLHHDYKPQRPFSSDYVKPFTNVARNNFKLVVIDPSECDKILIGFKSPDLLNDPYQPRQ